MYHFEQVDHALCLQHAQREDSGSVFLHLPTTLGGRLGFVGTKMTGLLTCRTLCLILHVDGRSPSLSHLTRRPFLWTRP